MSSTVPHHCPAGTYSLPPCEPGAPAQQPDAYPLSTGPGFSALTVIPYLCPSSVGQTRVRPSTAALLAA
ncbi:uncharacterized protein BDV17DRAFT_57928 [Aspergillus undulatus]|uniref:uncharacterized protein n=1 Tax=Aspergillus undulatus TaxID=1810928 RepID=UPI003CCD3301